VELKKLRHAKQAKIHEELEIQNSWNEELQNLQKSKAELQKTIDIQKKDREELLIRKHTLENDFFVIIKLKNGQKECQESESLSNFENTTLIHRNLVNDVNERIKVVGKQKVDCLDDIKVFRRQMNVLEWKLSKLDLEEKYYGAMRSEYQTKKVNKKDQIIIQSGSVESKLQSDFQYLERKNTYIKHTYKEKINKKKLIKQNLEKKLRKLKSRNQQLESSKSQAPGIPMIKTKHKPSNTNNHAIDNTLMRRKMHDLIKQQAYQLQLLKEEKENLCAAHAFPEL